MDTPLISFLIVNYKVADLVHQSIQSIQSHVSSSYEIIVLDNASVDGSVESLQDTYPNTRIISSEVNHGFGVGNNLAFDYAKGEFIFLLNPDTILLDDSVDRMAAYLKQKPEVGLVSPMLLYEDGSLQRSIRKFYSFGGSLMDNRFMNPVISKYPGLTRLLPGLLNHFETQEVDWAKGAALLIRREVIDQLGLFDPDYFIYGEEMDLCFRIGAAGWKKVYLHDCRIVHLEGKSTVQSSARMFLMNYKGMYLFLKKNFKPAVLRKYHQRVGVLSRLHYLMAHRNESKKALYKSLIDWHRTEARTLINS